MNPMLDILLNALIEIFEEIDDLKECPECGGELDHGVWIPTMTADWECENCDWGISYPYI